MALGAGTYIADDAELGLVAYGGILSEVNGLVTVTTRDPVRKRFFIGPLSLLVSVDAGVIDEFSFDSDGTAVTVTLVQADGAPVAANTVVWLESTGSTSWTVSDEGAVQVRQGWQVALQGATTVNIAPQS